MYLVVKKGCFLSLSNYYWNSISLLKYLYWNIKKYLRRAVVLKNTILINNTSFVSKCIDQQ